MKGELMKASEFMNTRVISVRQGATLKEAASLMLQHGINGLPVVDPNGTVQGMIGIRDVLRVPWPKWNERLVNRWDRLEEKSRQLAETTVDQVMSWPVISVSPDTDIIEVVSMMANQGLHPIPVMDEGRMLGIISRADVVKRMLELADATLFESEPITEA
jgi:CBS-domain-containing membrane protein